MNDALLSSADEAGYGATHRTSLAQRTIQLMGKDALSHQSCFSAVPNATSGPSAAGLIGIVHHGRFAYRSQPDR